MAAAKTLNRSLWLLLGVMLMAGSGYLLTLEGPLAKGSALWMLGFAAAALSRLRRARDTGLASQRQAFRSLLWMVLGLASAGGLLVSLAITSGERALIGMAILLLGFAALIAIPMVQAYRNRDSDQPWGIHGA